MRATPITPTPYAIDVALNARGIDPYTNPWARILVAIEIKAERSGKPLGMDLKNVYARCFLDPTYRDALMAAHTMGGVEAVRALVFGGRRP